MAEGAIEPSMAIGGLRKWRKFMRDGKDRERGYYHKIQGDMYVIHEVELFLLMSVSTLHMKLLSTL